MSAQTLPLNDAAQMIAQLVGSEGMPVRLSDLRGRDAKAAFSRKRRAMAADPYRPAALPKAEEAFGLPFQAKLILAAGREADVVA
jgi:hypothetical protein